AHLTAVQRAALGHLPTPSATVLASLHALLGPNNGPKGSNDWVVAGSHTTTGMPLLANDPHLGINYPAIWYEVALRGGGLNEIGYSFPGVPGIIIGHNDHIAWGVTNGMVDDTDLYIEQLSADQRTYRFNGQDVPVETRDETIKVSGAAAVHLTVRVTNHGPIMNAALASLKDVTTPLALQWTALQPSYSFAGFFEIGAATNWDEFQAALRDIDISQNFVYADTAGHIGYHLSGWLPERPAQNALIPVDGTTSANDWTGRVDFAAMPHLFDPASGIILTANNQLAAPDYPHYITDYYDVGFRAKRIEQLLTAQPQLSADDFARIQTDVQAIPATQIAPLLLSGAATQSGQRGASAAQRLLTGWDGTMTRTSAAAAFYEATSGHLVANLVQPLLGKTVYEEWAKNQYAISQFLFLRQSLTQPQAPILADAAARDAAIVTAENQAYDDLKGFFHTTDTSKWQWGQLHQAHFDHPLTAVDLLRRVLPNQAVARPGDASTVNAGGGGGFALGNYDQDEVPSMRQILDVSAWDASRFVTTTGESGLPFAAHNFDLLPLWDAGRYQPMDFTPAAVHAHAEATLTLAP
nr:penicillin acylase family protein [Ktedonobacterales bacterium]